MLRLILVLAVAMTAYSAPAEVLFPTPLHITRTIDDPISRTETRIDEYCYGDRVVAIRGDLTSIADYEKGELTEIDRARGTYSVTKFEKIAKARQRTNALRPAADGEREREIELRSQGLARIADRDADVFEARSDAEGMTRRIRIAIDRSLTLSREAVEVIVGAAYPNQRGEEHDVALAASRRDSSPIRATANAPVASHYALPLEHTIDYHVDGEQLQFRNRVTRIGTELAPVDLITIPPAARLVESDAFSLEEKLRDLDTLPNRNQ